MVNSQPTDLSSITTADALLAKLREGNSQKLEIGLGALKVPVRLLNAVEEATVQAQAEQRSVKENPQGLKKEIFEAQCVMKAILQAATTIKGAPGLPGGFLDMLTHVELAELYDQYITLNHTINPNVQSLSQDELLALVESVKKKERAASDFYTYQLAAIGKFFLASILPMLATVNERGSQSST